MVKAPAILKWLPGCPTSMTFGWKRFRSKFKLAHLVENGGPILQILWMSIETRKIWETNITISRSNNFSTSFLAFFFEDREAVELPPMVDLQEVGG